jgi:hypothetical protein
MATINLGYRLFAENKEEALEKGIPQIQTLWRKISKALESVRKDCTKKFPDLVFEIDDLETQYICAEEFDEINGKIVWDLSYWIEVVLTSPDGIPECDFKIDRYDRWREVGEPKYKDIYEHLHDCDWSSIKPFCNATSNTIGDVVSVRFDVLNAVDSYRGGVHFYNNQDWL